MQIVDKEEFLDRLRTSEKFMLAVHPESPTPVLFVVHDNTDPDVYQGPSRDDMTDVEWSIFFDQIDTIGRQRENESQLPPGLGGPVSLE